jgi:hypothetical protein
VFVLSELQMKTAEPAAIEKKIFFLAVPRIGLRIPFLAGFLFTPAREAAETPNTMPPNDPNPTEPSLVSKSIIQT